MKSNKDIFNEAFFKKETYTDKLKKKLPQYTPVNVVSKDGSVINSTFNVSDTDAAKKRLAGTFGVTFGNNNIKSMANRALKTFPILVSDAVEPDTVVMLKRLYEEQYAQYINLLVSNQIVDLSQYNPSDPNGNIAMQALDSLSGTDFSSTHVADKAANTGSIDSDDVFKNIALARLLKENSMVINTGDSLVDSLLENALVIPDSEVKNLVEYMSTHGEEFAEMLDEATPVEPFDHPHETEFEDEEADKKDTKEEKLTKDKLPLDKYVEEITGGTKTKEEVAKKDVYGKLANTSMLIDRASMDNALDKTVGAILSDKANAAIKDRFEKAVFLLECGRISGNEFIAYVTIRLGIPISNKVRHDLVQIQLRSGFKGDANKNFSELTAKEVSLINKNKSIVEKNVKNIFATTFKNVLEAAASVGVGAAAGVSIGAAVTAGAAIFAPLLIGAGVGAGVFAIAKMISKFKNGRKDNNVVGWERVEALINSMDRQRAEVIKNFDIANKRMDYSLDMSKGKVSSAISSEVKSSPYTASFSSIARPYSESEEDSIDLLNKELDGVKKRLDAMMKSPALRESFQSVLDLVINFTEETSNFEIAREVLTECAADKEFMAEYLNEASYATTTPVKRIYKDDSDSVLVPGWVADSNYAYGSAEIDSRVVKDRRYDQPLIITIKFTNRFADDRTTDKQLTAVIGILGKVIRIPSEEMKYILEANIEGETIRGLFDGGNIKNLVSDILSTSKISKDVQALPQSIDVWKNLEKVATLAAANKITGKKTNNVANAHIIFSQKEIDDVRTETGIDYFRQMKLVANLMKRYSAFTLMVANDPGQKLYSYDDLDAISWNVVPYSALMKDNGNDQLTSALARLGRI